MTQTHNRERAATINTNGLTWEATKGLLKLDETFISTHDYMGIAYFWNYEYRHSMRPMTYAVNRRIHKALLNAGLEVNGEGPRHKKIIEKMTKKHLVGVYV
jgi:hypothetical protein